MGRRRWPYRDGNWKEFHRSKRDAISSFYGGFDNDVLTAFYNINSNVFSQLLRLYQREHGASAATYARKTYSSWKSGERKPSAQTVERLLMLFPQVLPFDERCELLSKLRERHRHREKHSLTVDTNNWAQALIPLTQQLINKSYTSQLPEHVIRRLEWLSSGDTQAAQKMLAEIEAQTSKNAVRLLRSEFDNIDKLLQSLPVKGKVTHTISLPYGDIQVSIRRTKKMADDKVSLAPKNQSLFRPTARDVLDNAFAELDEQQAKSIKEKAAQEALQIEIDRARTGIKFDNASREMDNFIHNAQTLDQSVQEYDLRSTIESASGTTQVHVRRNKTQTRTILVVLVLLCMALLIYLAKP
jgi:hypothetical protein